MPLAPTQEAPDALQTPRGLAAARSGLASLACAALAALPLGCSPASDQTPPSPATRPGLPLTAADATHVQLDTMLRSEQLIERFRAEMDALAFAVRNLELPDVRTRRLFGPRVRVKDLGPDAAEPDPDPTLQALGLSLRSWPVAEPAEAWSSELRLWRALFDRVDRFHWASFRIKSGRFLEDPAGRPREFETRVTFAGLARLASGALTWIRTGQLLRWQLVPGGDQERNEDWRIVGWQVDAANRLDAPAPLFEDVLDRAVPDPVQRELARVSLHERLVARRLLAKRNDGSFRPPHRRFSDISNDRHPGLAVVDLDANGFDDLYVVTRWGRNQLLLNRGDGTFEEKAAAHGLDIQGFSSSAVFGDFDNDGDPDLFLGRTLERSAYYENQDGRFVDRSADRVDGPLPFLASSVSTVDYDGDGLLDVYVSTYSAIGLQQHEYGEFLSATEVAWLERLWSQGQMGLLQQAGPPNVLLHNEGGGRFAVVTAPGDLRAFRHTYQATWADFDRDGDPDVYLSNDFAPDSVIRNDGGGRFVDVTAELGFQWFGLGMGSSWGDYDRDGRQDVYVTNMYSTAGSRITEQLSFVDDRYRQMAQGNYLYRNEGDHFRKVSGAPPRLAVEQTGWSWGSQFVDVDNDGFLDLAVLNGFYTAPREVALAGDT